MSLWPEDRTELDAINDQHILTMVGELLTAPDLTPTAIRVFGPWGIGESSVTKLVSHALTAGAREA